MAKSRTPRLGRGLSSMFAQPVAVPQVDEAKNSEPAAPPQDAQVATHTEVEDHQSDASRKPVEDGGPDSDKHTPAVAEAGDGLQYLDLDRIRPNRHQPRQQIAEAALQQLADSIAREGVMQPIIVRPPQQPGETFELVAGERRWRAARVAGLKQVPVLVRQLDERQLAEWALIENLQREDLNPIERAEAFQRLIERFGLSHEEVAQRMGSDRSTISNALRLLGLGDDVRQLVRDGMLSAGHARTLAGLSDHGQQALLAQRVLREQWPVRRLEQAVRQAQSGADAGEEAEGGKAERPSRRTAHLDDLEQQLGQQLGTRVHIRPGRKKGSGTLCVDFYSVDEFDNLLSRLNVQVDGQ